MRQQLEQRLQQLKTEFESGQKVITDLDSRRTEVQQTMFRIQGAVQVLEEELAINEELTKNNENNDARDNNNVAVAESKAVEVLETETKTEALETSNGAS